MGWYVSTLATGLKSPEGVAYDTSGNLYATDQHRVWKITPAGTKTVLAGILDLVGSTDGTGAAARFYSPAGIACDPDGNLYVADSSNHRIRKVTQDGTVTTIAGSSRGYADGPALAAQFSAPVGIAIDSVRNLYVAEREGFRVRKITPDGTVSTIAGSGVQGTADGVGTAATFYAPRHLTWSADGTALYVGANGASGNIRRIDLATNQVTTVAVAPTGAGAIVPHPTNSMLHLSNGSKLSEVTPATSPAYGNYQAVVTPIVGNDALNGNSDGVGTPSTSNFSGLAGMTRAPDGSLVMAEMYGNRIRRVAQRGIQLRGDYIITEVDATSVTVTIPASVRAGDQIVARQQNPFTSGGFPTPTPTCSDAGFTMLHAANFTGGYTATWAKIATADDAGKQVTFTCDNPGYWTKSQFFLAAYYNASSKKLAAFGTAQTGSSGSPTFSYSTPTFGPNVATGAGVTATASTTDPAYPVSNAVDGNSGTQWRSTAGHTDWLLVDLGAVKTWNTIAINWQFAAKNYTIEASTDAVTWRQIYSTTTGPATAAGTQTLSLGATARYVRLNLNTPYSAGVAFGIYSFELYGPLNPNYIGGQTLVFGGATVSAGRTVSFSTPPPADLVYRGQANIPDGSSALAAAETSAGNGPSNLPYWTAPASSGSINWATATVLIPPPQGDAAVDPAIVTINVQGRATVAPGTATLNATASVVTDGVAVKHQLGTAALNATASVDVADGVAVKHQLGTATLNVIAAPTAAGARNRSGDNLSANATVTVGEATGRHHIGTSEHELPTTATVGPAAGYTRVTWAAHGGETGAEVAVDKATGAKRATRKIAIPVTTTVKGEGDTSSVTVADGPANLAATVDIADVTGIQTGVGLAARVGLAAGGTADAATEGRPLPVTVQMVAKGRGGASGGADDVPAVAEVAGEGGYGTLISARMTVETAVESTGYASRQGYAEWLWLETGVEAVVMPRGEGAAVIEATTEFYARTDVHQVNGHGGTSTRTVTLAAEGGKGIARTAGSPVDVKVRLSVRGFALSNELTASTQPVIGVADIEVVGGAGFTGQAGGVAVVAEVDLPEGRAARSGEIADLAGTDVGTVAGLTGVSGTGAAIDAAATVGGAAGNRAALGGLTIEALAELWTESVPHVDVVVVALAMTGRALLPTPGNPAASTTPRGKPAASTTPRSRLTPSIR